MTLESPFVSALGPAVCSVLREGKGLSMAPCPHGAEE